MVMHRPWCLPLRESQAGIGRPHLDVPAGHTRFQHRELAVAGIGALSGQGVELPQVHGAGQDAAVEVSLAELRPQMRAAVLVGPYLTMDVEQDDLRPGHLNGDDLPFPEILLRHDWMPGHRSSLPAVPS